MARALFRSFDQAEVIQLDHQRKGRRKIISWKRLGAVMNENEKVEQPCKNCQEVFFFFGGSFFSFPSNSSGLFLETVSYFRFRHNISRYSCCKTEWPNQVPIRPWSHFFVFEDKKLARVTIVPDPDSLAFFQVFPSSSSFFFLFVWNSL